VAKCCRISLAATEPFEIVPAANVASVAAADDATFALQAP
jgi:hypothetical protein